jgi:hypothetical protein
MDERSHYAKGAGILYLMLSFLAAAVLAIWIESQISSSYPIRSLDDLFPSRDAKVLGATIALLFVSSAAMGLSLLVRPQIARFRIVLGALLVAIAFTWGVGAGLLWLLSGLLGLQAYREGMTTDSSLQNRPPEGGH